MKKIGFIILIAIILILILAYTSFYLQADDENNEDQNNDDTFSDRDNDGVSDEEDDFPDDLSASLDTDDDGYPDEWNPGKNKEDSTSNLSLDSFPFDPAASFDSDNDGYTDYWNKGKNQDDSTSIPPLELDEFPDDPNAHTDSDKDGYADFYDINDNVNLSITLEIKKFKLTSFVDIFPWGQIYFDVSIGEKKEEIKDSIFGWWTWLNKVVFVNQKIEYDIPDNTKEDYTDIYISMYDFDIFKEDYQVDINDDKNNKSIFLKFNNIKNQIKYQSVNYGSEATIWFEITYTTYEDSKEIYDKKYNWWYKNKGFSINQAIPVETYLYYLESDVNRAPQSSFDFSNAMRKFVTSDEDIIKDLSDNLETLSEKEKFNSLDEANFILKFVQNIDYAYDNNTKGCIEYWRFPVETLVDEKGDCEDTSVLYASILDALGYDTVLFYYSWEQDDKIIGHIAVGLNLDEASGNYVIGKNDVKYYYCETTNKFDIGEMPDSPSYIKEGPYRIVYI